MLFNGAFRLCGTELFLLDDLSRALSEAMENRFHEIFIAFPDVAKLLLSHSARVDLSNPVLPYLASLTSYNIQLSLRIVPVAKTSNTPVHRQMRAFSAMPSCAPQLRPVPAPRKHRHAITPSNVSLDKGQPLSPSLEA